MKTSKKTFSEKVSTSLQNPLETFKWFERALAIFFVGIPVILRFTDKCAEGGYYPGGFRSSISDYVYMWHSYVFGLLLGMAAMLFIFNGAVYFRNEHKASGPKVESSGKWYNFLLGICLLGVVIFPWRQHEAIHFTFAGSFFVGNALVTGIFHTKTWRKSNIALAIATVLSLGFYFLDDKALHMFPGYTLFYAEWISVAVVAVHFYLETL
jgi:hypothetical protein